MDHPYWRRQAVDQPLYPDLMWSRPENKAHAGKLLIIGGNVQGFANPGEAYGMAEKAGAGAVRVMLPDSLQKTVGRIFPAAEFAPSTPSGSFAQIALAELLSASDWANGVLLAGDLARNSETAVVLEKLTIKYSGQLTINADAIDYFISTPGPILKRLNTLLVLDMHQLQKLAMAAKFTTAFTSSMDLLHLIDALHEFTAQSGLHVITKHLDNVVVASNGQVGTTKTAPGSQTTWELRVAASASIWWLQNPSKPFEAFMTSLCETN